MSPEPAESFQIFISYRRKGTDIHAGRLYDSLRRGEGDIPGFAADQIFMDIDTLRPGDDFRDVIREHVAKCDVLLAVIGEQWVKARGKGRQRRLDDPGDYVRLEIEAALERKIPVVPVLMYGATMPSEEDLPESLVPLVYREASELEHRSWPDDVSRLLRSLKERESAKAKPSRPRARRTAERGGTAKRKTATGTKAKPSTRSSAKKTKSPTPAPKTPSREATIVLPRFRPNHGRYEIGDVYYGGIAKFEQSGKDFVARVLLGPLTYGTLHGESVLNLQNLAQQMKTTKGDVLSVGDMVRVQITAPTFTLLKLPLPGAPHLLTYMGPALPGTRIGPTT